ncbi:alpha/beta hydrolase fold domain-containing protein [Streptomyces sp. Q6]|uniref:Alpha/beta hydrolase fold domain-containing protein n=1 Tax=Streptomyces citrinus TaxID=3118173 RepID=A0ACD5AJC7_9ACTN
MVRDAPTTSTPSAGTAVHWQQVMLPAAHPVPARMYRPGTARTSQQEHGWLVWAHGGSWQYGSAAQWHAVTHRLASLSGWNVLSVDYRLAPEHPYPAPLEDLRAAVDWARQRPGAQVSVAVGGDSAGATLAACVALAERDRGRPLAAQLLAYPPLDPDCTAASYRRDPLGFPHPAQLRLAWRAWRGASPGLVSTSDGTPLHRTPFDACSLAGVAPAVLAVGAEDPVADDVVEYAARLRDASVPVRLVQPPHTGHADLLRPHSRLLPILGTALRDLRSTSPSEEESAR